MGCTKRLTNSIVNGGGVLSLTLLFPPLFGLLQSGGPPWNEPVAYQYFYAMLLLTCLVAWTRRPGLVG